MIKEIIIGKKYVVPKLGYHRTPIHIYKGYVMYEHDYGENLDCALCDIGEFKNSVEETPEELFEVIYKVGNDRPTKLLEIYKWLSEGKKIRRDDFKAGYFLHIVNNVRVDSEGNEVLYNFISPETWSIYQEPEDKVKWFEITYYNKNQNRPNRSSHLYKSKEEFFEVVGSKESDYHFIILEEVKYE